MSREIKFRAFVKEYNPSKEAATMVYSDRVGGAGVLFRDFEDEPIMQFTGLKDVNGVEIYESDIVSDHVGVGLVCYSEKHAAFRVAYGNGLAKWFYDYSLKGELESIEVIGNSHQNPELLK